MSNQSKSCNVALIAYSTVKEYSKGDKFYASVLNKKNYEYYKTHLSLVCCGCGAKMTIVHKPNKENSFSFRAQPHHKSDECPYNHGNINNDTETINFYKDNDFAIDDIIYGHESTSPKKHGSVASQEDVNDEDDDNSKHLINLKQRKKKCYDLAKFYLVGMNSSLEIPFSKSTIGDFFITKRTIDSKTISNYSGEHLFVGTSCNPTNVKSLLTNKKLLPYSKSFILVCENFYGSKPEELYLLLTFENNELFEKFSNKFFKVQDQVSHNKVKFTLKVFILNYFKELYKDERIRILQTNITYSKQFKIEKIQKN